MKKQTKISLMVLVTLILTLALTIPGLAEETYGDCQIQFPVYSPGNGIDTILMAVPGVYTTMVWQDGTLVNFCEGVVPFEEPAVGKGKQTFLSYDDLAFLDSFTWTEESAIVTPETYTGEGTLWVFDTDGTAYPATDWSITIYPEGNFEFYKEYTP